MDICFDDDVVLYHLKRILGENVNICGEELKDFIEDLRKLIRREQRQCKKGKENTLGSSVLCKCHLMCHSVDETCSMATDDSMDGININTSTQKEPKVKSIKFSKEPPTLSFIKPWRLNPPPRGNVGSLKSDPVQLYQQYQEQWKQVRVPGETGHEKLRWQVRGRMLGQDPQPRPVSRSSVLDSRRRAPRL